MDMKTKANVVLCRIFHSFVTHMHLYLRPPFPIALASALILRTKVNTDTVHTMSLILGVSKPLSLEDMSQMTSAVVTNNFSAHHAETWVRLLTNSAGYGVPKGRPSAAGVKLVICFVERRIAAAARVDAGVGVVLVVGAGTGGLGAFLAEDAELL